jgi:hypothetical protein
MLGAIRFQFDSLHTTTRGTDIVDNAIFFLIELS